MALIQANRQVAYDNRTGAPEGLPREFVALVIDFPERVYGTWWYTNDDEARDMTEGWYIWIETLRLLGVSHGERIAWRIVDNFEMSLVDVANTLG